MKIHRRVKGKNKNNTGDNPAGFAYLKGGMKKYGVGGGPGDPPKKGEPGYSPISTDYFNPQVVDNKKEPLYPGEIPDATNTTVGKTQQQIFDEGEASFQKDFGNELDLVNFEKQTEQDTSFLEGLNPTANSDLNMDEIIAKENKTSEANAEAARNPIEQKQPYQFFNPYGGVDVMGAANIFGQNIQKGGDPLTAVASGLKVATGLGRSIASGAGKANADNFALDEYGEKRRQAMISENEYMAEEGGQIPNQGGGPDQIDPNSEFIKEVATGDYSTGTLDEENANAEVEVNEYIKTPDGKVTKVLGENHENDGEKMSLEDGTRIASDHSKIDKDSSKKVNEEYGIKSSTKDTYAKVIDKYYKAIGLQDLIDEEVGIVEQVKKQKEKYAAEDKEDATYNINLEFLSSRLNEIGKEKQPLQQESSAFFDEIYGIQESNKPKTDETQEFKVGGRVYDTAAISAVATKHGVDKNRAVELIKKYATAGEVGNEPNDPEELKKWYELAKEDGFKGTIDLKARDLGAEAGKIQAFYVKNNPSAIVNYFRQGKTPITSKGVDMLKKSNPELFKALGLDINKPTGRFTDEERVKLQKKGEDIKAINPQFYVDQFHDNMWSYRNVNNKPVAVTSKPIGEVNKTVQTPDYKADIAPYDAQKLLEDSNNAAAYLDNPRDRVTKVETSLARPELDIRTPLGVDTAGDANNSGDPLKDRSVAEQEANRGIFLLPDQSPLPPTGMQPSTKIQRRYGRADSNRVTVDSLLAEIDRGVAVSREQINQLPSGQREAAIVQLESNRQTAIDKATSTAEVMNAKFDQATQAFNIRQGDREEEARATDALSYEQRSLGALANTEDDFRNFFIKSQEANMGNFNTINQMNLTNAAYENFDITNDGVRLNPISGDLNQQYLDKLKATQAYKDKTTSETKKKKQYGGKIKRGRKKR